MAGIAGQEKLAGIFRFLGEDHDWDVTLVRTAAEFTPSRMRDTLKVRYDGFIVSIPNAESTAALLATSDVPTVVMDIHDPSLASRKNNIVFIRNDPRAIGQTAADFLLTTGRCRSYAFVQNPSVAEWGVARFKAFRTALHDRGFWCHDLPDPSGLTKLERPIGVFAANDDCGYDTLEFCRAHRLRVPEDCLVLGTNNDTLICENCHPKLTSIQPDFEQEGFLAAQTLARMMKANGKTKNKESRVKKDDSTTLNSSLSTQNSLYVGVKQIVRRDSTAEISPSGKLVQKALAFIRKNALRGISVDDVARHLKVSRRLADLRFRELQDTTIGETIITLRLNEVKRLLRTTKEPIDAIAASCGYESPNYLKNLFKKRFAMTMREFRNWK